VGGVIYQHFGPIVLWQFTAVLITTCFVFYVFMTWEQALGSTETTKNEYVVDSDEKMEHL